MVSWEDEGVFEVLKELAWEGLHRAVCAKYAAIREPGLSERLRAQLDQETHNLFLKQDTLRGDEEAEGIDYVIRLVFGVATQMSPERLLSCADGAFGEPFEDLVKEASQAAGLDYIPEG